MPISEKLQIVNMSVVMLGQTGQNYNPLLLTPEFLRSARVTTKQWELAEAPLLTPPISIVKYSNDIVFVMELNKVHVVDNNPDLNDIRIQKPAIRLIERLPHARHVAVGINITGIGPQPNATDYLATTFVKPGPWLKDDFSSIAMTFVYVTEFARVRFSFDKGKASHPNGTEIEGILIDANYHHEIPANLSLEASSREAIKIINEFPARLTHYQETIEEFFQERARHK